MLMWRLESETIFWTHNCCWMGHPKQTKHHFLARPDLRCTKQLANTSLGWHDGHYKTHEVSSLFHNQKSEVFRHGWWGGSPSFFIIRWWYLVWKYVWADEFSQMFQQFFFMSGGVSWSLLLKMLLPGWNRGQVDGCHLPCCHKGI